MADVVPLRRRGCPEFGPPAATFLDAADPGRALSVAWSPDASAVRLGVGAADGPVAELVLDGEDVLELVRALVEGLPAAGAGSRPPAPVVPLTPRAD